jgi:predicted nucleic acid-binding protein
LGVLILNVKKKYISKEEAVEILKEIQGLNFRVSKRLEESFLAVIGWPG